MHLLPLGKNFGEIKYTLNGELISSVNIVAKNDVNKLSGWNMITHVLSKWFCLCR